MSLDRMQSNLSELSLLTDPKWIVGEESLGFHGMSYNFEMTKLVYHHTVFDPTYYTINNERAFVTYMPPTCFVLPRSLTGRHTQRHTCTENSAKDVRV
jgi:hypothetical protein